MRDVNRCECGSYNLWVTDSRRKGGLITRARTCKDCNKKFYTIEMDRADFEVITEMVETFENLKKIFSIMSDMTEGKK